MSGELQYYGHPTQTGLTVVAKVYDADGTQVGTDVSTTESGSTAIYIGDMPSAAEGKYGVRFFSGGSLLGQGAIYWTGTAEATIITQDNTADIAAIKAKTDALPADLASNTQVATRLAAADYVAPDNAGLAAIKAKTDALPADPASEGKILSAI